MHHTRACCLNHGPISGLTLQYEGKVTRGSVDSENSPQVLGRVVRFAVVTVTSRAFKTSILRQLVHLTGQQCFWPVWYDAVPRNLKTA